MGFIRAGLKSLHCKALSVTKLYRFNTIFITLYTVDITLHFRKRSDLYDKLRKCEPMGQINEIMRSSQQIRKRAIWVFL
jgi:hypothetical protein